ncbi:putative porin [Flammeovirgaceae bacterium SG7u.111]|nr:putative porin [Flammeovirgaceae bacterium SG7u.132]WPO38513.1 putative porin [Flammeovirgaceae bacterium SG7u.111]
MKLFINILFFLCLTNAVQAQIPNQRNQGELGQLGDNGEYESLLGEDRPDSARVDEKGRLILEKAGEQVYGTGTTFFIYESDWRENSGIVRFIDTLLNDMHRYNFVAQDEFELQDLGTTGSATKPLYYKEYDKVGVRFGYDALDPYLLNPDEIEYFDTRSPHTSWYYVQGGAGRSILDVKFARNVSPQWNVGFRIRRINAKFLVGNEAVGASNTRPGNLHEEYQFNTRYESENKRYKLLAYAEAYRHSIQESGGLEIDDVYWDSYVPPEDPEPTEEPRDIQELFRLGRGQLSNRLTDVESFRRMEKFRVFQQYSFIGENNIQLYHIIDKSTHLFNYDDQALSTNSAFYPNTYLDTDRSVHYQRYQELSNTAGLKGKALNFYYSFFAKNKLFKQRFEYRLQDKVPRKIDPQNFIGFKGIYTLTPSIEFRGEYESMIGEEQGNKIFAAINTKYLVASHTRVLAQPDQNQLYYYGNHFQWDNYGKFDNTLYTVSEVALHYSNKFFNVRPFAKLINYDNYIYYGTEAIPIQTEAKIDVMQAGLDLQIHLGDLHQKIYGHYTSNSNPDILRMPELFGNYQIYLEKPIFKSALFGQVGLDFHWHNAFYADAYMPVTQQFYLQNDFEIGGYLMSDIFINLNIKSVNFFAKLTNALQGIMDDGYFITPGYMGQSRQFEFGLVWNLYD